MLWVGPLSAVVTFIGVVVFGAALYMASDPLSRWTVTCNSPCHLLDQFKTGGKSPRFISAAASLYLQGKELRVDTVDECNSACKLLVDHMKNLGGNVCVGQGVLWGIHLPWETVDGKRVTLNTIPVYSAPPIVTWIRENGGIPANGDWLEPSPPSDILFAAYGRCSP